jgi:hypothetical protein
VDRHRIGVVPLAGDPHLVALGEADRRLRPKVGRMIPTVALVDLLRDAVLDQLDVRVRAQAVLVGGEEDDVR